MFDHKYGEKARPAVGQQRDKIFNSSPPNNQEAVAMEPNDLDQSQINHEIPADDVPD